MTKLYKELELQNWVFHINPYTKEVRAVKREHYIELFNGGTHIVSAESFDALCEKILNKELIL